MAKRADLIDAIETDDFAAVTKILDDPNAKQVSFDELQAGCYQGHMKVVPILLDHGGRSRLHNINEKDGRNVLHCAAQNGSGPLCKLLVEIGVSASLKDKKGKTAADLWDDWQDPPNPMSTFLRDAQNGAPNASAAAAPKAPAVSAAKLPPPAPAPFIKKPVVVAKQSTAEETDKELAALLAQLDADELVKKPAVKSAITGDDGLSLFLRGAEAAHAMKLTEACTMFEQSKKKDCVLGMYAFGYFQSLGHGTKMESNSMICHQALQTPGCLEQLLKQAENGVALAQFFYALIREHKCKPLDLKSDKPACMLWLRKSVAQNFAYAQYHLAVLNQDSGGGYYKEAFALCLKAALQGHIDAMFLLSYMYEKESFTSSNKKESSRWLEKAAEMGSLKAKNRIKEKAAEEAKAALAAASYSSSSGGGSRERSPPRVCVWCNGTKRKKCPGCNGSGLGKLAKGVRHSCSTCHGGKMVACRC